MVALKRGRWLKVVVHGELECCTLCRGGGGRTQSDSRNTNCGKGGGRLHQGLEFAIGNLLKNVPPNEQGSPLFKYYLMHSM
jgi:hypothetical protein